MKTLMLVWSAKHELGIPILDEQHRGIVSIMNTLFALLPENRAAKVFSLLDMAEMFVKVHFYTEENILRLAGYPGFEEHRQLHVDMTSRFEKIQAESRRTGDPANLLLLLRDLWTNHINNADLLFAEHVRARLGLAPRSGEHIARRGEISDARYAQTQP